MQLLVIGFWIFFGWACSLVAQKKGRHPLAWFGLGLFLGIFGVLLINLLPSLKKAQEPLPAPKPTLIIERNWYYLDAAHKQHGPISHNDLRELYTNKTIDETSYVWCEEMSDWKRLRDLPEITS